MSKHLSFATAALALLTTGTSVSGDFEPKPYHDDNCLRCHDTSVYTREDRRISSYPALESQVARCDANLALKLFPDDLAVLVEHMNDTFYHFDR